MEIGIRHWSRPDIRVIGALLLDSYREMVPRLGIDLIPDADSQLNRWLQVRVRDRSSIAYIAECGDQMAGFLMGRIDHSESEPPILKPRRLAWIEAVYVLEGFRRQGVATALVKKVIERAESSRACGVETSFLVDDPVVVALWNSLGFASTLTRAHRRIDL